MGAKDAVTPLGRPEAEKVTALLNPFVPITEMVLVPMLPCAISMPVGEGDSAKLTIEFTVRETVVDAVSVPDVPVIVIVAGPVVAELLAVSVITPEPVVDGLGLKLAVTPLGNPDAE